MSSDTQKTGTSKKRKVGDMEGNFEDEKYDKVIFKSLKQGMVDISYWQMAYRKNGEKYQKKCTQTVCALLNTKNHDNSATKKKIEISIPKSWKLLRPSNSNYKEDFKYVLDLVMGKELVSYAMDYYVSFLIQQANSKQNTGILGDYVQNSRLDCVPVYFLSISTGRTIRNNIIPNFNHSPKKDLKNSIVFAPLQSSHHYFLAVYYFPTKRMHIFDSALYYNSEDIRFHHAMSLWKVLVARMPLEDLLEFEEMKQGWKCIFENGCAQQEDDKSCGYFVINYIQHLLNGDPEKCNERVTEERLREIRESILKKVLPVTDTGKKILDAITV